MSFTTLTRPQIDKKINFIKDYAMAQNAASGSAFDPNANVSHKNITTLSAELFKDFYIQMNRSLMYDKITELYDEDLAKEYIR